MMKKKIIILTSLLFSAGGLCQANGKRALHRKELQR